MPNTLSIARRAERDLEEAFKWYEARSLGLGHEFFRCVEARLDLIVRNPRLFRQRGPLHRLARTDRFPYAIYFIWEEGASHVMVRRVLHFSRNADRALRAT